METHFQTSFIPKKPMAQSGEASNPSPKQGISLLMTLGVFLFIVSIAIAGGAYGWKYYLLQQRSTYVDTLTQREAQFSPDRIKLLSDTDKKISLAKSLIKNHLMISDIFNKIAHLTVDNIRFVSMSISSPDISKPITVSMSGYGPTYQVVAFQSDALGQLEQYGLHNVVLNPVLTNPVQNQNGTISFDFSATINPSSILYDSSASSTLSNIASSTKQ